MVRIKHWLGVSGKGTGAALLRPALAPVSLKDKYVYAENDDD